MSPALKDKVAIITGAGRGIGKAFALRFADEGAKLLLPDISLERAQETVNEIKAKGGEAFAIKTDISDENDVRKMADEVMSKYGRVDILINNAAIWFGLNVTPWDAWSVKDWEKMFSVNVIGTWLVCKTIAPLMAKQSKGKIINIASTAPKTPSSFMFLPYCCSKEAIYTLTHALAMALGQSGINVNAIAPGYTASEASINQQGSAQMFEIVNQSRSIQRREEPSDLVGAAVFLASGDSDFITGQVLNIDGGTVMS
jgi:NAD(P)-dependent dehydrogenase (short-subunit alcohol dehydrogenase family)